MRFRSIFALPVACAFLFGCSSSSDSGNPSDDTGVGVDSSPSDTGTKTDSGSKLDSSTTDSGLADTATTDSATTDSATTDSSSADTASSDTTVADSGTAADTAPEVDAGPTFTLKIEDYLSWCTVAVNGGASDTTAIQTFTLPAGSVANLDGDTAGSFFVWGYWRGTDGDTTASHDTAQITTVTMSGNKTVQACCPLASSPTTPCPAPTP